MKLKNNLFCLCFLAMAFFAQAQNTLPLLGNDDTEPRPRGASIKESLKYKIADSVYQRLVAARGDYRYPAPKFSMTKSSTEGATMNYDSLEITLEEKAYDVCASFGAERNAALAIILGHELIHYYEKHGWRKGFASEYSKLDIGTKLGGVSDDVPHETQADYLGGFLAYSAGYGLFEKCPELISGMYKAYKLKDTLSKYPVRQDRENMSRLTIKKLEKLVSIFDLANMLAAMGNHKEARLYYKFVLKDYQSREIFNNIGVTALMEVLKEDNQKLFYPIELDLNTKLGKGSSGWASQREALLREAISHFNSAISLDPEYAPGYLNKACAYALLEPDMVRAKFYAEVEAKQIAKAKKDYAKTASDVNVLLGIIAYSTGDSVKARQIFESEAKTNPVAAKNLKAMDTQTEEEVEDQPRFSGISKVEMIDSIKLSSFVREPSLPQNKDLTQKIDASTKIYQYSPSQTSKIYMIEKETDDGFTHQCFHITKPNHTGATINGGIKHNSSREDILLAFKKPKQTVETPRGEILVYSSMIFILDTAGKLVQWVNYTMPK